MTQTTPRPAFQPQRPGTSAPSPSDDRSTPAPKATQSSKAARKRPPFSLILMDFIVLMVGNLALVALVGGFFLGTGDNGGTATFGWQYVSMVIGSIFGGTGQTVGIIVTLAAGIAVLWVGRWAHETNHARTLYALIGGLLLAVVVLALLPGVSIAITGILPMLLLLAFTLAESYIVAALRGRH